MFKKKLPPNDNGMFNKPNDIYVCVVYTWVRAYKYRLFSDPVDLALAQVEASQSGESVNLSRLPCRCWATKANTSRTTILRVPQSPWARVCECVCVWLYLTVSLTVCAGGSAQLLWHWLSRWAKQCVGPWSWVSGSWVRSWVVGLGLCLCPGSLSLCLSRVLVLSLVLELASSCIAVSVTPLPGPFLPLGLTVLTCLVLLCLFYALQCLPAVCQFTCRFARPLASPLLILFPSFLFALLSSHTHSPCAGYIHIWMPACSVCLSLCRPLPAVLLFTSVTPKAISNLAKLSNQLKYY